MTVQEYADKITKDLDLNYGDSVYIQNILQEIIESTLKELKNN